MSIYAPISSEVVAFLHEWTPYGICEIGAGDGTWLTALNQGGIDAIGYDIEPRGGDVRKGNHVDASGHGEMAFLAVWPPDGPAVQQWIDIYRGNMVILCGDFRRFNVGDSLSDFAKQASMKISGGCKGPSTLTAAELG
jgi:hypothetical protein